MGVDGGLAWAARDRRQICHTTEPSKQGTVAFKEAFRERFLVKESVPGGKMGSVAITVRYKCNHTGTDLRSLLQSGGAVLDFIPISP
jgi:hypothetical protein